MECSGKWRKWVKIKREAHRGKHKLDGFELMKAARL